jgi:4'-phosphopantetheinyl transferase
MTTADGFRDPRLVVEASSHCPDRSSQHDFNSIVRIWLRRLDCPAFQIAHHRSQLTAEELAKVERFRHAEAARRYIVCRSNVRSLLAQLMGCKPAEVPIGYDGTGKPVLPASTGWYFNVSHSADYALIGITRVGPIGVDIEKLRDGFQIEPIAQRFFSLTEASDLLQLPPEDRVLAFFRCWTRKEAFIKAVGLGLAYPLDQFDVTLLPHERPAIRRIRGETALARAWALHEVPTPPGYVGALAVPRKNAQVTFAVTEHLIPPHIPDFRASTDGLLDH